MELTPLLYADDDDNDLFIFRRVADKVSPRASLNTVDDGLYAIDYLCGHGSYADRGRYPIPKIILSDVKMPRVSGIGLLRWVRQQREFTNLPFVILSSSNHGNDIQSAQELGANGYLIKTSSPTTLIGQVQDLINVCRARNFSVDGWLPFKGNQMPPPGARSELTHPAAVFSQSSWIPTLRHPEH